MKTRERIIVTMTSWYKRINNVSVVLETLLKQSLPADKIILNFCIQDFPNMEEDFPEDLKRTIEDNQQIEIYWYIENYKAWKKHLHVLEIAEDNDLIISTDDDRLYPTDFIEKMYVSYCYYGKTHPVTLNRSLLVHNSWCFNGPGTIYKKSDFPKDYKKYLSEDVLNCFEDTIITSLLAKNKVNLLPEIFHMPSDKDILYNDVYSFSDDSAYYRNDLPEEYKSQHLKRIGNTSKFTVDTVSTMFDELYFNKIKLEPGEPYFIPRFWKFHVDLIEDIKHKMDVSYVTLPEKYIADMYDKHPLSGNNTVPQSDLTDVMKLDMERYDKSYYIGEGNKLVITISSWNKRIGNCYKVISDILYNTFSPDEIVLNLAKPDFGIPAEKNPDLHDLVKAGVFPEDLYTLIKDNSCIKVHWYEDSGYRSWKKYLYVGQHYKDDDVIIAIDDDVLYKETFIETMVKSYHAYDKKHPISCLRSFCQGAVGICGYAFLFTPKFLKIGSNLYSEEIYHKFPEDNHLLNVVNFNGYTVMPVIGYNYLFYSTHYNQGEDSTFGNMVFTDDWWTSYNDLITESERLIRIAGEGREELKMGWKPIYFNFNMSEMIKYLRTHKREELIEPVKHVYDTIDLYLNKHTGSLELINDLDVKIDSTIL